MLVDAEELGQTRGLMIEVVPVPLVSLPLWTVAGPQDGMLDETSSVLVGRLVFSGIGHPAILIREWGSCVRVGR